MFSDSNIHCYIIKIKQKITVFSAVAKKHSGIVIIRGLLVVNKKALSAIFFFIKLTDVFRLVHAGVEELTVHVGHPENEVGVGIARTQVTTEYHPVISGI